MVWVKPFTKKGKVTGETRLIDLGQHYQGWLENVAHGFAQKVAEHSRKFNDYLE